MRLLAATAMVTVLAMPASSRDKSVWTAIRSVDPITGKSSCIVSAYDRAAGMSFTRIGVLYPIVEMNSEHGLLVGVSSGGRVRIPSGDILWRVDDLPYRELKAANNPANRSGASALPADAAAKLSQDTLALTQALTATSTVASGDTAWAMLDEMRRGKGLQYRQAEANAAYGLPQASAQMTGQLTKKGLAPFPLDASFQAALTKCGIGERNDRPPPS